MSVLRAVGPAVAALVIAAVAVWLVLLVLDDEGTTSFVDLEVGDCFDLPSPDDEGGTVDVLAVELVDCDEPHDVEVVAVGDLRAGGDGDDEYPGFEAVDQAAAAACAGTAIDSDRVGVVPVAPTEGTWTSFDGRYACLAIGAGPLVGSVLDDTTGDA